MKRPTPPNPTTAIISTLIIAGAAVAFFVSVWGTVGEFVQHQLHAVGL